METLASYLPENVYSMLVMGVIAIGVIWLVMTVVRKLIGLAVVAALVIGGFMIWQDPALLWAAQDRALGYYDQWRYGGPADDAQSRW